MLSVFPGMHCVLANGLLGGVETLQRAVRLGGEDVLSRREEADSFHAALELYRGNLNPHWLGEKGPDILRWLGDASTSLRYLRSQAFLFPNSLGDPVGAVLQWLPYVPRVAHENAVDQMRQSLAILLGLQMGRPRSKVA